MNFPMENIYVLLRVLVERAVYMHHLRLFLFFSISNGPMNLVLNFPSFPNLCTPFIGATFRNTLTVIRNSRSFLSISIVFLFILSNLNSISNIIIARTIQSVISRIRILSFSNLIPIDRCSILPN